METDDFRKIRQRIKAWRLIVLAIFLFGAFSASANQVVTREPRQYFFTQSFGDLIEELETAKAQDKKGILLFFEAEDCRYCHAMLQNVLSLPAVQDWYREHFLNIAIDIHGDIEIKDVDGITLPSKVFSEHRQVFMTPVLSFLDLDGREVYRHLGMVKTPEEFLMIGEYVTGGHYFDTEFKVYANRHGLQKTGEIRATRATEHVNPGATGR